MNDNVIPFSKKGKPIRKRKSRKRTNYTQRAKSLLEDVIKRNPREVFVIYIDEAGYADYAMSFSSTWKLKGLVYDTMLRMSLNFEPGE